MDGNGRWAKRRGLPRREGHKKGMEIVEAVLEHAVERGIKFLSLFAFSTENWIRPKKERDFLFSHFAAYLLKKRQKMLKEGIRLNVMGRRQGLPKSLTQRIDEVAKATEKNEKCVLNIVFNYGGRAEIVDAVRALVKSKASADKLTEEDFSGYLYDRFIPDVDLLIRTSGEERISNFLLWRLAYSEIYFTTVFWPDFKPRDLDKALDVFAARQRRYGGLHSL